jgi:glycosyltransferase involved in cell wall biosynthesis
MTRSQPPSLTLVYLMYDEEENIAAALDEGVAWLGSDIPDWEIVVVDDGSTDAGPAIVEEYATGEPRIRLVRHERNLGMGGGMRTGIREATREYLCFMPSDGQVEATELRKLLPLLDDGDVALSVYESRGDADSLLRVVMSRSFRAYLRVVAGVKFELEGLYLYPTALAQEVLPEITGDTFFFSFQLVLHALARGRRAATTTIVCKPRAGGASKVANGRRVLKVLREVLDYRKRKVLR